MEGREKEMGRKINVWLPHRWPYLGTWTATQACALTGNQNGKPLVRSGTQSTELHRPGLNNYFIRGENYGQTSEVGKALFQPGQ